MRYNKITKSNKLANIIQLQLDRTQLEPRNIIDLTEFQMISLLYTILVHFFFNCTTVQ